MKPYKFDPNSTYADIAQLASEHGAKSLHDLGREFYDRTRCGVSTQFMTVDESFHYEDEDARVRRNMPKNQFPIRNVVGVKFTSIVEGSNAEIEADPLYFPFTDKELAETWDWIEGEVDSVRA